MQDNERGIPPIDTWGNLELNELYEVQTKVLDLFYLVQDSKSPKALTAQYQRFVDRIDDLILSKEAQLFGN